MTTLLPYTSTLISFTQSPQATNEQGLHVSFISLLQSTKQIIPGAYYTVWTAWINEHSHAMNELKAAQSAGIIADRADWLHQTQIDDSIVGKLAMVFIRMFNGARCPPPNIESLCFLSPRQVKHTKKVLMWYTVCRQAICRESFKTNKESGYPTESVVTGFDLYKMLNDYGYSYAVISQTVSS